MNTAAATTENEGGDCPRRGIYLGLPHADYLADPALGSSSIKDLIAEPARYWHGSWMNPNRPPKDDAPWLRIGSAFHCLALEGRAEFKRRYCMAPGPEYLRTVEQIGAFIREKGGKPPKLKAQVIADALALDPAVKIYDVAVQAAKGAGMEILKEEEFTAVVRAAQAIATNPFLTNALTGGQPEVSVFWTEEVDGVSIPCKARFDNLKPRANVDLKSMRPKGTRTFEAETLSEIASRRYDIQAAHYQRGRAAFAEHWEAGRVFGLPDDEERADTVAAWARACAAADAYAFVFVFWSSEGAPMTRGWSLSPGNPVLEIADKERGRSLANYAKCWKEFGPDRPWFEPAPVEEVDINSLPVWFGR